MKGGRRTRPLGRTGLQVSELCFGTMSFGGDADESTSAAMYKATRDAGINFYDCANQYNKGKAEEVLGRLVAPRRIFGQAVADDAAQLARQRAIDLADDTGRIPEDGRQY